MVLNKYLEIAFHHEKNHKTLYYVCSKGYKSKSSQNIPNNYRLNNKANIA